MSTLTAVEQWRYSDGSISKGKRAFKASLVVHTGAGHRKLSTCRGTKASARAALEDWRREYPKVPRNTRGVGNAAKKVRLPIEPLLQHIELAGGLAALGVRADDAVEVAIYHGRQRGTLTLWMADELAVKVLRTHPMLVWGDAWFG